MTIFGCLITYLAITGFLVLACLIWYIFYSTADEGMSELKELLLGAVFWPLILIGGIIAGVPALLERAKKARIARSSAKHVPDEPKVDSVDTLA